LAAEEVGGKNASKFYTAYYREGHVRRMSDQQVQDEEMIQLIVVPPPGAKTFTMDTTLDATIEDVMNYIATRTKIPVANQVLTHGGAALDASSTIRHSNLQDGAQLTVTPSVLGGCGCSCGCTIL
jgi:hypothetical protein